jgi:hypothetical protein
MLLETLPPDMLDAMQQDIGERVGVMVVDVTSGSPAASAGVKPGDFILYVGQTGVPSAEAAAAALNAASGAVELRALTWTDEGLAAATYSLTLTGGAAPTPGPTPQPTPSGSVAIGWMLQPLDKEALDKIEAATKYRVGVAVTQVASGSIAAQGGIQPNDIICVVGGTPVNTPEGVAQAVEGKSGSVVVAALRAVDNQFQLVNCTLALSSGGGAAPTPGAGPTPVGEGAAGAGLDAIVSAYFDMLDFSRTQAWGRQVSTPAQERANVAARLQEAWGQLDPQVQGALGQIPGAWAGVQKNWGAASEQQRAEHRARWQQSLLLPNQLLPPPANVEEFRATSDGVILEYPTGWLAEQTESEGSQYLYLGPPGTQASWNEVINPQASPAGALFVVTPITEELKSVGSFVDGARLIARQFVTMGAAEMKEIGVLDLGNSGAVVSYAGRFPGQQEDKFFWVGSVRYGSEYVFVGRLGGPVSQAEVLLPAFDNMLNTLQLNPAESASGGDYGAATVDYYASKCGNIAVSGGW